MELSELSSAGGRDALPSFAAIYESYFDFVWRSVRRLGVEPPAVDDVVQEVFVVVHARLSTLNNPGALRSWIYGILRRTTLAHLRMCRRRGESPIDPGDEGAVPSSLPTPLDAAEHADQIRTLWELLTELDEPKREAFMLVELEEMTMPEVAQALELPLGTVYSRVRAARQAFEAAVTRLAAKSKRGGRP